ncbi:methyltransferase [Rhodopseudomonas sp. HC1]|uniref:tRNA1(Val) (adenine(37)-N6)-methyltransferase n=1 Tax=Rhodopseudomonas infernalis TaxID=2897386 RepID=UPI001EE9636F|nr:methyltransferase [Rhodopseudomonas infernalis]MCG6207632.1 methyltransferase [Rhodopseudomonas infernalis]
MTSADPGTAGPAAAEPVATSEDGFLGGRLRLRQPIAGHRAGHDAILLAAATAAHAGDRVVEFGTGVGTAGLALAHRVAGLDLVLVEIEPRLAALAEHNAAANRIDAHLVVLDVAAGAAAHVAAGLAPDGADVVLMNPPFNHPARHRGSPDAARRTAHVANPTTLECWVHAARRTLRPGGVLSLIWRADGLGDVLATLGRGFGDIGVIPVYGRPQAPAIRVLVQAVKGSRAPLQIHPPLILNGDDRRPTAQARAVLDGEQILPVSLGSG